MTSASGPNRRCQRGAERRTRLGLGFALLLTGAATLGLGCVEPQAGSHAKSWCAVTATSVVLDDFEDGDDAACPTPVLHGRWTVVVDPDGTGASVSSTAGIPSDLSAEDMADRPDSTRAQHLSAPLAPGGTARLVLTFDTADLSGYKEIDFWARSDAGNVSQISVAVGTASAAGGDYFSGDVTMISTAWGEGGSASIPNNVALRGIERGGVTATDADLVSSSAIEFRLPGPAAGSGNAGLWIDDVVLKRNN